MGPSPSVWRHAREPGHASAVRSAALAALVFVSGCQLIQNPSEPAPGPVAVGDPPIEAGPSTPAQDAAAASELARAREALAARDYAGAQDAARRTASQYPAARGSSEALWVLAQAAFQTGDFATADSAASQYANLMPEGDRRSSEASLLAATALSELGQPVGAVRRLLETDPGRLRPILRDAGDLVRAQVRLVETSGLGVLSEGVAEEHPLLPAVLVEYGIGLYFTGQVNEAATVARRVLAIPASEESDREVARSLLSGRVEETVGAGLSVGLVLPSSGSPTMQEYATSVREGVEVALQEAAATRRRPVGLSDLDDSGDPNLSRRAVQQLETDDVIAVVGPLLDRQLQEAAQGRSTPIALISPTAGTVPEGFQGVYSLGATDPGAAIALAGYAVDRGYRRLALIYPSSPSATDEARAFRDAFAQGGRGEVREFTYEPGATSFGGQLLGAADYGAEALVLPIPDEDIELLAPQVSHFGLDTLGIDVMGTAAWGEAETLNRVDARHTDGVVIASPRSGDGATDSYVRFRAAYEALHRKTLRSPVPAFGYDAARLVLEAIEAGARSPADLVARLGRISEYEGATGRISIVDGRIVRRHALYEIRQGQLIPTGRAFQ